MSQYVPKKQPDGIRYFGRWARNPVGHRENDLRCVVQVSVEHSWVGVQCSRKRGHGPEEMFCKQHAKKASPADLT